MLLAESQRQSSEDVVRAHHRRNGFPRAPSPERLRTIRDQQHLSAGVVRSTVAQNNASSVAEGPEPSSEIAHPTVAAPDGELQGHPTKLRSYPFGFRPVIERAKLIAQCDSATKNPFPVRSTFLDVSSAEIFSEALLGCENVPAGKSSSTSTNIY